MTMVFNLLQNPKIVPQLQAIKNKVTVISIYVFMIEKKIFQALRGCDIYPNKKYYNQCRYISFKQKLRTKFVNI